MITQPGPASRAAFTDNSRDVLSFGPAGNAVLLWDAGTDCESPRALLRLARCRVTRKLTPQERAEFGVA